MKHCQEKLNNFAWSISRSSKRLNSKASKNIKKDKESSSWIKPRQVYLDCRSIRKFISFYRFFRSLRTMSRSQKFSSFSHFNSLFLVYITLFFLSFFSSLITWFFIYLLFFSFGSLLKNIAFPMHITRSYLTNSCNVSCVGKN